MDLTWVFVVFIASQCGSVAGIIYPNLNFLPTTQPFPISILDPQSVSVIDHNLLHSNGLAKYTAYGAPIFPSTSFFGSVKSPSDIFDDTLLGYYHNGRHLKQYFVMEDNLEDLNGLNNFLNQFNPYVPPAYNIPASRQPNLGFPSISPATTASTTSFSSSSQVNDFYTNPRSLSIPVQLGSGSLGYIRLPNGAIYLGSGSLGYVNDRQKSNELNEIQNRQSPQASPLTFGETPR